MQIIIMLIYYALLICFYNPGTINCGIEFKVVWAC